MSFGEYSLFGKIRRKNITREMVEQIRNDGRPHRICFASTHKEQPKRNGSGSHVGNFSLPFEDTVKIVFQCDTKYDLQDSNYGGIWRKIEFENEFNIIDQWARRQGTRIFLRDCLDMSIALDFNFIDNNSGRHTILGDLERRGKHDQESAAVDQLVDHYVAAIKDLPRYRDAKHICAIPPSPGKLFDLPTTLAAKIAARLGLENLSCRFQFKQSKQSIKEMGVSQKWDAWEQTGLTLTPELAGDPAVILIDDKYQSGITMQYIASKLLEAGAGAVYGLSAVKTMKDTDNV